MKILVVEDERLALDDLLAMLQPLAGAHTIIGCTSGAEALVCAAESPPDLVIADIRMPGIDGLELLRRLKSSRPDLAALLLSGHSEFAYAREGIRLGITDYLLKPIRTEALLRTVSSTLAGIAEERSRVSQLREARLVRLLLGGRPTERGDRELLAGSRGLIISVCENWDSPVVWRDTSIDRESMARVVDAAGLGPCDIVGIDGHIRVLLTPMGGATLASLDAAARRLHQMIVEAGMVVHTTWALKGAGESAATLLDDGLRRLGAGLRFAAPSFLRPGEPEERPSEIVREQLRLVERAVEEGQLAAAAAQAHAVLAQLRREEATQAALAERLDELFQILQRHPGPRLAEPLPDRGALRAHLRRLRSYDDLAAWVDLQLQPLLSAQRGVTTPRQVVRALVAHVQAHYAENISFQAFAAEHGVSLAYFSRLFKDEVGMTFSDYLSSVRIERAKELLARSDMRLSEISGLVGYEDAKYFSQIFRRATGMSPLDYQRSRQRAGTAAQGDPEPGGM